MYSSASRISTLATVDFFGKSRTDLRRCCRRSMRQRHCGAACPVSPAEPGVCARRAPRWFGVRRAHTRRIARPRRPDMAPFRSYPAARLAPTSWPGRGLGEAGQRRLSLVVVGGRSERPSVTAGCGRLSVVAVVERSERPSVTAGLDLGPTVTRIRVDGGVPGAGVAVRRSGGRAGHAAPRGEGEGEGGWGLGWRRGVGAARGGAPKREVTAPRAAAGGPPSGPGPASLARLPSRLAPVPRPGNAITSIARAGACLGRVCRDLPMGEIN